MSPGTTRRRLSAEERRAGILDAALEVFAEEGYRAASIDQIAGVAGISKALIYEHFPSKAELHVDLIRVQAADLFERLAASAGEEPGPARLESGLAAYFGFVEERRDAWRLLFREPSDPRIAEIRDGIVDQVTRVVAALIAEDPAVRHHDERVSEMLAQMLVGATQSLADWWSDHPDIPRARVVEMVMDFAWVGLDRLRCGERWSPASA